jgi:CHASE3 domain sensor protein
VILDRPNDAFCLKMTIEKPVSKPVNRLFVLGLVVPCLLISIPAVLAYRAQQQQTDSFHWVAHTIEVQHQLQRLLTLTLDAESNQRVLLLTSREGYLLAYERAVDAIPLQVDALRRLTADNPVQQENLRQLDPLIAAKVAFMAQTVTDYHQSGRESVLKLVNTDQGKVAMEAIRARLALMDQEESRLLIKREQHLGSRAHLSTLFLFSLVVLNLLFMTVILLLFQRYSKMRNLVTICAWSRTVEYQGEWLSFEQYLHRRFHLDTSHGISPTEAEKVFGKLQHK